MNSIKILGQRHSTPAGIAVYHKSLSVELYIPQIYYRGECLGMSAGTLCFYRPYFKINGWRWKRAFAIKLFGFGIGFAINHVDNPNFVAPTENG